MKEDKNMFNILFSSNIINMVCNDIADNKTNIQVTELLIEVYLMMWKKFIFQFLVLLGLVVNIVKIKYYVI